MQHSAPDQLVHSPILDRESFAANQEAAEAAGNMLSI